MDISNLNEYQLQNALKEALASGEQAKVRAIIKHLLESAPEGNITYRATEALIAVLDKTYHPDRIIDMELVRLLLEAGASVASPFDARPAALHLALLSGRPEIANMIMDAGAEFNCNSHGVGGERKSMLVWAIEGGQTDAALRMLAAGVNPHGTPPEARPLQAAARFGNLEVATELLRLGVDINEAHLNPNNPVTRGSYMPSNTALMEAAKLEDNPVLEFLLEKGANLHTKNDLGANALHSITHLVHYGGVLAERNAEILLKRGADPNVRSPHTSSPLINVINAIRSREKVTDHLEENAIHRTLKLLFAYGADLKQDLKSPEALLERAIGRRDIISVLLLLEAGMETDAYVSDLWILALEAEGEWAAKLNQILVSRGLTPDPRKLATLFETALESGDGDRVRLLINHGADVNAYSSDLTLLHDAVDYGFADIVLILLEAGANPNARTLKTNSTPLFFAMNHARRRGERNHIPYQNRVLPKDPTAWAIEQDLIIVRALLEAGTDIEVRKTNGCTVLHLAALLGSPPVLRTILDDGADVNSLSDLQRTPLLSLLRNSRVDTIKRNRAAKGLQPYHRSNWDSLPNRNELIQAARWDEAATHLLLAAGSNALAKGLDKYSALALAVIYGTPKLVQMIIDAGASSSENRNLTNLVFRLGRTKEAIEQQGFKFESFSWLKEELQRAAIGELDLTKFLPYASQTIKDAIEDDVAILRMIKG